MYLKYLSTALIGFIIAGCGGGGTPVDDNNSELTANDSYDKEIKVVDGYIQNSTVLIDINTKTVAGYDDGDIIITTDSKGSVVLDKNNSIPDNTIFYATGGVNSATNEEFVGTLSKVYENEKEFSITPLTTMISAKFKSGTDLDNAKEQIANSLNITKNDIDSDPLINKNTFKATRQIVVIANLIDNDIGNALNSIANNIDSDANLTLAIEKIDANISKIAEETLDTVAVIVENLEDANSDTVERYIKDSVIDKLKEAVSNETNITEILENAKNVDTSIVNARECLTFDLIKGENSSASDVTKPLDLDAKSACEVDGVTITWINPNDIEFATYDDKNITLEANISNGELSNIKGIDLTLKAQAHKPTAVADSVVVNEDESIVVDVLANDIDEDGFENSTITIEEAPSFGVATVVDKKIEYTPNTNFYGADSLKYKITDEYGAQSIAQVSITVTPVNDAPVVNDDNVTIDEDNSITIDVLANDSDIDSNLTIKSLSNPLHGIADIVDGKVVYTPSANYNGRDSFEYTVSDGDNEAKAVVNITINAVNDAPVLGDINIPAIAEDSAPIEITLTASDADQDALTFSAISSNSDILEVSVDGNKLTLSPKPQKSGKVDVTVSVSDAKASDSKTVEVTIVSVNDAPVANDDSATVDEDSNITIDVLANDSDEDSNITLKSVDTPANGVAEIKDGKVVYTPNANFNGNDRFSYTITDGENDAQAFVNITINPINDAPVANDDSVVLNEDSNITVDVLANDNDIDSNITIKSVATPTNGVAEIKDGKIIYTPNANFNGSDSFIYTVTDGEYDAQASVNLTVNPVNDAPTLGDFIIPAVDEDSLPITVELNASDIDGDNLNFSAVSSNEDIITTTIDDNDNLVLTPKANQYGEAIITVTVSDGEFSASKEAQVVINAVNDAPTASDDSVSVNEDENITVDVLANDSDIDSNITLKSVASPTNGVAEIKDGKVVYTPNANFNGSDSFSYTITDGEYDAQASVNITVNPVNDAPTASDDNATVNEDSNITIDVLANDSDIDSDLTIKTLNTPANGVATIEDGKVVYTPNANFNGSDSFIYTVTDGEYDAQATVNITVNPVNDAPVVDDITIAPINEDSAPVDITINASDIDGDTLSYSASSSDTTIATVSMSDNILTVTPQANKFGDVNITVSVSDGELTTSKVATLTINPVNDAPVAYDINTSVFNDASVDIELNATDIDSSDLTYSITQAPANGEATVSGDKITYTPNSEFIGNDTIEYQVSDGELSATATINIDVQDAKILVSGEYSVIDLGSGDINKTVKIEDGQSKSLYILFTNASEDNATVTVSDDAPDSETLSAETTTDSLENTNGDFNQVPIEIIEFNNKNIPPKDLNGSSTVAPLSEEEEEQEGDTKLLYAYNDEQNATLRKLIADIDTNNGTRTLKIWVADNTFGDDCNKSKCLTQDMVDEMADAFLKDGLNNDIYDWVSNIYGPEWGPHDSSYLIPESDEINIYLIDLGEDDSANGGTLGYFWAMENYTKDVYDKSNERVMFFIDSVMYANRGDDGESDYWKIRLHSTLAHELQHMIHFYQRNVKRGLDSKTWFNEMLSGATQDAVADKIGDTAIRGLDPTIGDAGSPGIRDGRFPGFNDNNDKSLTNWVGGYSYSLVASFATYVMRNYGGVKVLGDMQHYESNDILEAVVGAINDNGGDNLTFEDILKEWGIGVILSDKTDLPDSMPRYNFGDFIYADFNGITYDLGSINFFNYEPQPKFYTESGTINETANYYYKVGENLSGDVKIDISIPSNVKATLIAK